MDCDCGYGLNCPERVWDHVSEQHAAAHQKGRDGLAAAASWDIRHIAADSRLDRGRQGKPPTRAR